MGFIYTQIPQKALAAGAPPQTPHSITREIAFGVCQSDTPGVRGANSHLRPGRQKPSVRHCPWRFSPVTFL